MTSSLASMRSFAGLFSLLILLGCSQDAQEGSRSARTPDEEVVALAPDRERLLERAHEFWQHKQAGDWIQVYDFLAPQAKQATPLGKFLSGKENHIYEDASDPLLLKIDEDRGFVEIHVQWTPTHPILATVDNADGPMSQILDEVDEWIWSEGEWWLAQQHRVSEIRKTHPHLWAPDEQG